MLPNIASHCRRAVLLTRDVGASWEFYRKLFPEWQTVLCAAEPTRPTIAAASDECAEGWYPLFAVDTARFKAIHRGELGAGDHTATAHPDEPGALFCRGPQGLKFAVVDAAREEPAAHQAPFAELPATRGAVTWVDWAVDPGTIREVALFAQDALGLRCTCPLDLGVCEYVTLLNSSGDLANRHKICGVTDRTVVTAKYATATTVPKFCVESKEAVEEAVDIACAHGGEVLLPPLDADGWVSILQGPFGETCGVYARNDAGGWDGVKETTQLTDDVLGCDALTFSV